MKKIYLLMQSALVALACVFSFSAAQAEPSKPRVALVMKSLANEFFYTMEKGAKEHQKAHSDQYQLITNGIKDERDTAGQIKLMEQMIAAHVDAIVIAPADSKALVPVSKRAIDAGIVVVNIDNPFDAAALKEKTSPYRLLVHKIVKVRNAWAIILLSVYNLAIKLALSKACRQHIMQGNGLLVFKMR